MSVYSLAHLYMNVCACEYAHAFVCVHVCVRVPVHVNLLMPLCVHVSVRAHVCVFVGGIAPGDELMAVNGKILVDASLTEGQNSLARAWGSGGVPVQF